MKPTPFISKKTLSALLGSALIASALPAQLSAATTDADDLKLLRQQIEALTKKVTELEQQQHSQQQATQKNQQELAKVAESSNSNFKVTAGPGGFGIATADKDYSFTFKGLLQFDNRLYFDDASAVRNQFVLRRLRPIFQGTIAKIYEFSFVPELGGGSPNSSTFSLVDAWISATPYKEFGLKFGKFASPAALEPGSNVHFIESPLTANLLPNRDIGIESYGSLQEGLIQYRAGVFAGARNNTTGFNSTNNGDKSFAGRLTLNPFITSEDTNLSAISLSIGTRIGRDKGGSGEGLQNYVTNGQQTFLNWGNLIASGERFQINPAIEWYPKAPYSAVAEFALDSTKLQNASGDKFTAVNNAWRLTGGYVLTGENRTKRGVKPDKPFDWSGANWGAFEVVARVSGLHVDNKIFDSTANGGGGLSKANNASGAIAYGGGLNWYLNENFRVLFNVEQTNFKDGDNLKDELYFFTRFQLQF